MDAKERRIAEYDFISMKSLRFFFRDWLAEEEMEKCIAACLADFRIRHGVSTEETELQRVKKCEETLFRNLLGPTLSP
jgi:hypothetical protein